MSLVVLLANGCGTQSISQEDTGFWVNKAGNSAEKSLEKCKWRKKIDKPDPYFVLAACDRFGLEYGDHLSSILAAKTQDQLVESYMSFSELDNDLNARLIADSQKQYAAEHNQEEIELIDY